MQDSKQISILVAAKMLTFWTDGSWDSFFSLFFTPNSEWHHRQPAGRRKGHADTEPQDELEGDDDKSCSYD